MDIICSRGKSPLDGFPNFILVEFPKFKGPSFPGSLFYLFSYLQRPPTIFPDSILLVGAYW